MRIAANIAGIVIVLIGGLWILQGSNLIGGSVMSGQSQWLWIGIVVALAGLASLIWFNRRR
jgi:Mg2+ and Co2+ transporter CorA